MSKLRSSLQKRQGFFKILLAVISHSPLIVVLSVLISVTLHGLFLRDLVFLNSNIDAICETSVSARYRSHYSFKSSGGLQFCKNAMRYFFGKETELPSIWAKDSHGLMIKTILWVWPQFKLLARIEQPTAGKIMNDSLPAFRIRTFVAVGDACELCVEAVDQDAILLNGFYCLTHIRRFNSYVRKVRSIVATQGFLKYMRTNPYCRTDALTDGF